MILLVRCTEYPLILDVGIDKEVRALCRPGRPGHIHQPIWNVLYHCHSCGYEVSQKEEVVIFSRLKATVNGLSFGRRAFESYTREYLRKLNSHKGNAKNDPACL